MTPEELMGLSRSNSSCRSTRKILPSNYIRSSSLSTAQTTATISSSSSSLTSTTNSLNTNNSKPKNIFIRSLLQIISLSTTCRYWLTSTYSSPSTGLLSGRNNHNKYKLTGTLFGHKKGHVTFAVQDDPRSDPVLLLELATSTSTLVKEMASGLLRIALECKRHSSSSVKLFQEPMWTMYCNGKKCGYAVSRTCGESDWHVLNTVRSVSIGAGVIPVVNPDDDQKSTVLKNGGGGGGEDQTSEFMYMRAKFERVVGSRDSEAFYMLNPDGSGGPELSIFLLRI